LHRDRNPKHGCGPVATTTGEKGTFLIAEQLQAARAAHWRQKQSPILTLDDAQSWLEQHPLCLFLPRQAQLPAPAPSFVEACVGSRQTTPGAAAIEQAHGLLTRLIASGTVVPLNLLGTVSEQPDFLAHSEALPYVLSLRAESDWKHAPQKSSGHKVSPLVLELWKALDKEGALSADEARETLGRELTEAAVLRALCELWQALRISPVLADAGQPARWEMLRVRHRGALETGSTTSQVTALSLLVSMYLQSVYAASSEEIEIFLSPVASRSRVREAVRGLSATRQIHSLSMDAQTYYFLENGLPEFAQLATPSVPSDTQTAQQSLPAQRPRPRKIQATARPAAALPVPSPAPPPSASAPIFRRSKPAPGSGQPPVSRPERRPEARPMPKPAAGPPAARAGWKTPARPGSSGRPEWKPAARGAHSAGKDERPRGGGKPRPAAGARPAFVPGRSANRPYVRPGTAPPDARPAARPEASGGAQANHRPGTWSQKAKRERSAPWALPGRKSGSGPRPPRPGGRGDSPFRPAQTQRDRPKTGSANERTPPFRPRGPRGERGPGDPRRARSAPGRPQAGPPSNDRSPVPYSARPARGIGRGGPPARGGWPSAPRFGGPRSESRSDGPRPDSPGRPFPRGSRPTRPPSPGGAGRSANPTPNPRGTNRDRPRPAGYVKPGTKGGSKGGTEGRSDRGPKPPFVPGSRPAKSWARAGSSAGKPGERPTSFRGSKPDRKKPGA
jgi:23S rRNA pseudouridine2605 synthase